MLNRAKQSKHDAVKNLSFIRGKSKVGTYIDMFVVVYLFDTFCEGGGVHTRYFIPPPHIR